MCFDGDVTSIARWRRPLIVGVPALLGLVAIAVLSFTGEVSGAGLPRSDTRYLTDSFRQPGPLDQAKQGDIGWSVLDGTWFSNGIAVNAQDVPARLEGDLGVKPPEELVVRYAGSPSGSELVLRWWPSESWGVRFGPEQVDLVRSTESGDTTVESLPISDELADSPLVSMRQSGRSLTVSVGSDVVFQAQTTDEATGSKIAVVATDQAVTLDRVEAEVLR